MFDARFFFLSCILLLRVMLNSDLFGWIDFCDSRGGGYQSVPEKRGYLQLLTIENRKYKIFWGRGDIHSYEGDIYQLGYPLKSTVVGCNEMFMICRAY